MSDARGDVIVFTRLKHIIYSSDSKAEQILFIWITVAAEVTGIGAWCSGCLVRPHLPWRVWSDGETEAQSKSVVWLHLCPGSFLQLGTQLGFISSTWARGFQAARRLLGMCEATERDCNWSTEVHSTSSRDLDSESAKVIWGLSEMSRSKRFGNYCF